MANSSETEEYPSETRLSGSTGNHDALDSLANKYNECRQSHPHCATPISRPQFIPSRLIYVGNTESQLLHLHERDQIPQDTRYVTLSHCWGDLQLFRLTNETTQQLKSGLEIRLLPKTFREAIVVLKYFNLEYIWIDSL
jgi:hypothetical protein